MSAGIEFETAFSVIARLCWLPSLLVAEFLSGDSTGNGLIEKIQ